MARPLAGCAHSQPLAGCGHSQHTMQQQCTTHVPVATLHALGCWRAHTQHTHTHASCHWAALQSEAELGLLYGHCFAGSALNASTHSWMALTARGWELASWRLPPATHDSQAPWHLGKFMSSNTAEILHVYGIVFYGDVTPCWLHDLITAPCGLTAALLGWQRAGCVVAVCASLAGGGDATRALF